MLVLVSNCSCLFVDEEKKDSVKLTCEENYLNSLARRQTIVKSIQHVTYELPKLVVICLLISIVCSSFLLPFFKMLECPSPFIKAAWRAGINTVLFLPMMIRELMKYRGNIKNLFALKNILSILLCQIFGTMTMICQLIAMQYTYVSHVLLFSGMVSIVFMFWKLIKRLL